MRCLLVLASLLLTFTYHHIPPHGADADADAGTDTDAMQMQMQVQIQMRCY